MSVLFSHKPITYDCRSPRSPGTQWYANMRSPPFRTAPQSVVEDWIHAEVDKCSVGALKRTGKYLLIVNACYRVHIVCSLSTSKSKVSASSSYHTNGQQPVKDSSPLAETSENSSHNGPSVGPGMQHDPPDLDRLDTLTETSLKGHLELLLLEASQYRPDPTASERGKWRG